jgi:membrane-anchored protein YejM (alkaline phosphatase superfamily)
MYKVSYVTNLAGLRIGALAYLKLSYPLAELRYLKVPQASSIVLIGVIHNSTAAALCDGNLPL